MKPDPGIVASILLLVASATPLARADDGKVLFRDDFEGDLAGWEISHPDVMTLLATGDPIHRTVFQLEPGHLQQYALMRGSDNWKAYRVEGYVLFPTDRNNYLGWIYNFNDDGERIDLGSIYIKGNGSYIRMNPRRDWNPARNLYEEWKVDLTGDDAIEIGSWHRFAAEVEGNVCHFYVDDMVTPKATFDLYEHDSGKAGFKPRVVGGSVWIDDIRVTAIRKLSYQGPRLPEGLAYDPDGLLTRWKVLGPLTRTVAALEDAEAPERAGVVDDGTRHRWRRFETDARGAVVTGQVVDFLGPRTVAYFLTRVDVGQDEQAVLEISSLDDVALWVNGVFEGYGYGTRFAWYDFREDPLQLPLPPGENRVLIRVRGGKYAGGGFFARVRSR